VGRPARHLAERVRLVYADSNLTAGINLVNTGILAFVQRDAVDGFVVAGWTGYMLAVVLFRLTFARIYRRSAHGDADARRWAGRLIAGVAAMGVGWGAAGVLMMPVTPTSHQVFTAFVLAGMAAGGVPTLGRLYRAYVVFAVPTLSPAILFFLLRGTELGVSMAVMGSLLLVFLLFVAKRQQDSVVGSLRLADENATLVEHLREEQRRTSQEKARAEDFNRELVHEITEREQVEIRLREREEGLANAQRIAHLGSWDWDIENDRINASEENHRLFGRPVDAGSYTMAEALERVHADDRGRVDQCIQTTLRTGKPYHCEYRVVWPDGSEHMIFEQGEVSCSEDGRAVRLTGTNFDITERYRTQEQLRAATDQAEAASEAKSQFLANMSHELRTPLNAIIGYSEILREDAQARGQEETVDDLDRINSAGRHLLTLVNEVLDLARIEAGRTDILVERIDVGALVDEVVSTVAPLAERNGNRLIVHGAASVTVMWADATKLRQVLYNLLANAAKFTSGGEIRVDFRPGRDDTGGGRWIVFEVADTGIGIPPDRQEAAFNAFDQADLATTRQYGGTGLGLAISRHYCEAMGGAIWVRSEVGKGSTFTVRLPANVRESIDSEPAAAD
jgi:signal transduction histidine kinase